ncbi:hypothetical protein AB4Z22_37795, partial [Paenibacillus sp. TAF58]
NLLCGINTTSKAARKLSTLTPIPLLFYFALPSTSLFPNRSVIRYSNPYIPLYILDTWLHYSFHM